MILLFYQEEIRLTTSPIDGRGYVKIKDGESFGLDPPHFINVNATYAEPVYMVSVFHQLHCLVRAIPLPIPISPAKNRILYIKFERYADVV